MNSPGIRSAAYVDLCSGNDNSVWMLTDTELYRLTENDKISVFPIPSDQLDGNIRPTCIIGDTEGNIWIGTTGGLIIFNTAENKFREFIQQSSQGILSDTYINCIFIDKDNYLWIGTRNGLNKFDPVDFDFKEFYPSDDRLPRSANNIVAISAALNGDLILGTATGVIRFNIISEFFSEIMFTDDVKLKTVAVDHSDIIWCATDQGLIKIRKTVLPVVNFTGESELLSIRNNSVTSLFTLQNGDVFIGYPDNRFNIANIRSLQYKEYTTTDGSKVVNMYPFRTDSYIVLSEHDLMLYQNRNQTPVSLTTMYPFINKRLLQSSRLSCMVNSPDGVLWLGTDNGIQQIRFDSLIHREITQLKYGNLTFDIQNVFDIEQDASGILWLATDQGLISYNTKTRELFKYTLYDKNFVNTANKAVYTIVPGKSGEFWLGTSGGAYRFTLKNKEFSAITTDPTVMKLAFQTIALDTSKNIWLGTRFGLYYFRPATNSLIRFDQKEGLINYEFTAVSSDLDGNVYTGGPKGLSVVSSGNIKIISNPHNVVITALRFLEKEPTEKDLFNQLPDTIYLPWNRKIMQVDLAVLDFSKPEQNGFRYAFGEPDEETIWYELGTNHQISFEPLSPGEYLLYVKGTNSGRIWSNNTASLVIVIEAPYWRSKLALFLYITFGVALLTVLLWFFIRQLFNLSRENQEREMFAKQIMVQKEELTLKNKSITDSINYAKRIQTAMLPPYKLFKSLFPSSFILYIPKDIVSGDFYWINKLNNKIFIAAVDCTGHGVPGAFMSIIGFELFRKITNIEGLTRPSDILNRLNEDFHIIFQDVDNVVLRDGMDVAFCSIDKKDMILEYSGAFNPLYLIRDNKITEIKGDRFAIGLDETNFKEHTFKNHFIPIQRGDIIYIFSDGFADQFGGPDGKKYKYRRFRHLLLNLHQLPMEKQHEILENNVMEWRGGQDQVDDILVIGIKIDF